jgi:hypothetical protein
MLAVAGDHDLLFWQSVATSMRGVALAHLGRGAEGLELARQGAVTYRAAGGGQIEQLWLLAICCERAGAVDEGLAVVDGLRCAHQRRAPVASGLPLVASRLRLIHDRNGEPGAA